jgi:hypothetical protein
MAPNQAQQTAHLAGSVTYLRALLAEFVLNYATLEDLLQVAMICTPEVADIIREVQSDGQRGTGQSDCRGC